MWRKTHLVAACEPRPGGFREQPSKGPFSKLFAELPTQNRSGLKSGAILGFRTVSWVLELGVVF
ncbi:hypothetical protein SAMN04489834_2579 [Microterricola viridarii]|uniref:Uncharacterized protein n=1 Tax=Microterricola viridarii TaxID=412690 RepID=A0A1H1WNL8_9MICO|nr:hypothetical protein SAMN04489834_2579 [Microterricola viridarii]